MNTVTESDESSSGPPRETTANRGENGNGSFFARLRDWIAGRRRRNNGEAASLRDALEELAEEAEPDAEPISSHERTLLENVIQLRDLTAYDVRVPRADIVAVQTDTPLEDLIQLMLEKAHSRLPVYGDTLDDCIGIVHIKELLACCDGDETFDLGKLMRRVLFVAPSMRLLDLLLEMRLSRTHMALVVDEYGGIDGLVTIEDLVEEIVGEIEDEHDIVGAPHAVHRSDGTYLADARHQIKDFEERLNLELLDRSGDEDHNIDTLGGLVFHLAGRVPGRGELIDHPAGLRFEIVDADPRRIRRLRVHLPHPSEESAEEPGRKREKKPRAAS